jgi:Caspase domain
MADDSVFAPRYENSLALVIGINEYTNAPPLSYACNDAVAIAKHLRDKVQIPESNVRVLLDKAATREAIVATFLQFVDEAKPNDRVLVFFAGHGYTRTSRRGEVGYLVPRDGNPSDLATLIRWDELTRNADLIPAKHVLFIMDACYGGLALTRNVPPGSHRFLKDMLSRYSRQVLTAGKADEVVADAGGPRAGHSIFTGHLLDGLEGAARSGDGIITANGVMAYVYERVGKDQFSHQSPHYGFLDGDGDFVFEAPQLSDLLQDVQRDTDLLVAPAEVDSPVPPIQQRQEFAGTIKEYLSDNRYRIRLDDLASHELRAVHQATGLENFPTDKPPVTADVIAERLRSYERATDRFACLSLLLACWGTDEHRPTLTRVVSRLVENNEPAGGLAMWIGLRWYPAELVLYAAGIAALSSDNYSNLATLLLSRVSPPNSGQPQAPLLKLVVDGMSDSSPVDPFKALPGHERNFTPRSEYLFKTVQPMLEDLLYLGRTYEPLFDRYEILAALSYADFRKQAGTRVWGPPGRFAWKAARGLGPEPYSQLRAEAEQMKDDWVVLRAGFFGGSFARFTAVADEYRSAIAQFGWG